MELNMIRSGYCNR